MKIIKASLYLVSTTWVLFCQIQPRFYNSDNQAQRAYRFWFALYLRGKPKENINSAALSEASGD
jgi:hypothetical protein